MAIQGSGRLTGVRDLEAVSVLPAGRVVRTDNRGEPFLLADAAGEVVEPVRQFLLELLARDLASLTLRSYANDLLRWWRFLGAIGVVWDKATPEDVRDFILWMRTTRKLTGSRQARRIEYPTINAVTGKAPQGRRYSAATINHAESVVHDFYEFHLRSGLGPMVNPVIRSRSLHARRNAHHNPLNVFRLSQRGAYRQKLPRVVPRGMSDEQFDALFKALRSDRDRALLAFYISSGVRANELLSMTGDSFDPGEQLIRVRSKGTRAMDWVPAAAEAFVWLRLYQDQVEVAKPGEPLWVTLRHPRKPLGYDALRAVIKRANVTLGSDWSIHDFRHTAAHRMLGTGMSETDVQTVLRHAHVTTTQRYVVPRLKDLVAAVQRAYNSPVTPPVELVGDRYDPADLEVLFGRPGE